MPVSGLVSWVWSPKTGLVHRPYGHWRSGDHRPGGLLLARGPRLRERRALGALTTAELGASICDLLGVPVDGVEGKPSRVLREALWGRA